MEVGWNKVTGRAEYAVIQNDDEDFARFDIRVTAQCDIASILEHQKAIIEYTQRSDNKIVDILDIWMYAGCVCFSTKFFEGYYPLVFIRECKNFYANNEFDECGVRYRAFMQKPGRAKAFYESVVCEMRSFTEHTGLYFEDISGNNILVNEDFTDFRIIDVGSIAVAPPDYPIDPVAVLVSQKMVVNNWRPDDNGDGGDPFFISYVGNPEDLASKCITIK